MGCDAAVLDVLELGARSRTRRRADAMGPHSSSVYQKPGRGQTVARVDTALGCRLLSGVVARSHLSSRRLASRDRFGDICCAQHMRCSDRRGSVPWDGPRDRGARTCGPTLHMQLVDSARVSASPAFGDRGAAVRRFRLLRAETEALGRLPVRRRSGHAQRRPFTTPSGVNQQRRQRRQDLLCDRRGYATRAGVAPSFAWQAPDRSAPPHRGRARAATCASSAPFATRGCVLGIYVLT